MIEFTVHGIPGPQGSKSFKGRSKKTGKGILVESSKKVKPWREAVELAAKIAIQCADREIRESVPINRPLVVRMVFTLPKPASAPKRRKTWPDRMPDLDKLARSTGDALTSSGLIADDARIVEYSRLAKVYAGEDPEALDAPGVRIRIESAA